MRRRLFILAMATICLVFLSGMGVGVVGRQAAGPVRFRSVLAEELDLTPEQRHQIEQIWSKAMADAPPPPIAEVEAADAERRREIDRLLTPEQLARYGQIQDRFEARLRQLDQGNRARLAEAEEQTKRLLTPAQRERYEQLLSRPKHQLFYIRTSTRPG